MSLREDLSGSSFDFLKLALKCLNTKIDGFFECVGCLGREKIRTAGHVELDSGLFVERCLRLYDAKVHFGACDVFESTCQLVDFLLDEGFQFVGDVEVDSFYLKFHSAE